MTESEQPATSSDLEFQLIELVRAGIAARGWTIMEFADKVGVQRRNVSGVLNYQRKFSLRLIEYWLHTLGYRFVVDSEPLPEPEPEPEPDHPSELPPGVEPLIIRPKLTPSTRGRPRIPGRGARQNPSPHPLRRFDLEDTQEL